MWIGLGHEIADARVSFRRMILLLNPQDIFISSIRSSDHLPVSETLGEFVFLRLVESMNSTQSAQLHQ